MNRSVVVVFLTVALQTGCAALVPRPEPSIVRNDPGFFLLAPAAAGFEASLTQEVSFERGAAHFECLVLVDVSSAEVVLAGLSPFGSRMLSLRWDGKKISQERDASLPQQLPSELILRDFQLTFWPSATIRAALPRGGWTLRDEGRERDLLKAGQPVVRIRFSGDERLHADVDFEHIGLGYRLSIHPAREDRQ